MPMSSIDERPKTLKSGISLKTKYAVQHRSDMLIAEQVKVSLMVMYLNLVSYKLQFLC